MRGPLAGLGDSAAAKSIHREASPGLRLRTKTHGPLQNTPSRDQNPLRLRVPSRSIPLTHTQKKPSGASTAQPLTPPHTLPASALHYPGLVNARVLGQSVHAHVHEGRARSRGSQAAVLPVLSFRPPAQPAPLLLARPGRGWWQLAPSPSLPIGQTVGRAPPSIGYGPDPFPQPTPHWLKPGTTRPFAVMELGTPITSSPPQLLVPTALAGCAPPALKAQAASPK